MLEIRPSWNNLESHKYLTNARAPFLDAIRLVVSDVMQDNFHDNSRILEVGSGTGALAQFVPSQIRDRMISLDLFRHPYIHSTGPKTNPPFVQADVQQMPFCNNSFQFATGLTFLSSMDNIGVASKEIHRVLKPGGSFVHFLDILPDFSPLVNDMVKKGILPFLDYDKDGRMIFSYIDKRAFNRRFDRDKLVNKLIRGGMLRDDAYFIGNEYLTYAADPLKYILDLFKLSMLDIYAASTIKRAILSMVSRLELLNITLTHTAPVDEVFGTLMVSHLKNAGFRQVGMEYVKRGLTVPDNSVEQNSNTQNHFYCLAGNPYSAHTESVEKGYKLVESTIQTIIAKK